MYSILANDLKRRLHDVTHLLMQELHHICHEFLGWSHQEWGGGALLFDQKRGFNLNLSWGILLTQTCLNVQKELNNFREYSSL